MDKLECKRFENENEIFHLSIRKLSITRIQIPLS